MQQCGVMVVLGLLLAFQKAFAVKKQSVRQKAEVAIFVAQALVILAQEPLTPTVSSGRSVVSILMQLVYF